MTTSSDASNAGAADVPANSVELARQGALVAADLGRRYSVVGLCGQGAFATVWRVSDRVARAEVAVKCLRMGTQTARAAFYRELRAHFKLAHPRVSSIINFVEGASENCYLILEYCGGGSLSRLSRRYPQGVPPMQHAALREIAAQIAEGLDAAHRVGLVHCDLKPGNIMFEQPISAPLENAATIKIVDFGLARAFADARRTPESAPMDKLAGTPLFMAPEQFLNAPRPASDIYALGIILWYLLLGRPPFDGSPGELARAHLYQAPTIDERLDPWWRDLLGVMLAKEPENRPTALSLIERLRAGPPVTISKPGHRASATVDSTLTTTAIQLSAPQPAPLLRTRCLGVLANSLWARPLQGQTSEFFVGTPNGFFRLRGERHLDFIVVPGWRFAAMDHQGVLWLARGAELWAMGTGETKPSLVTRLPAEILALVAAPNTIESSTTRLVLLAQAQIWRVCESNGDFQLREGPWLGNVDFSTPPAILALADGGCLVALHDRPGLLLLDSRPKAWFRLPAPVTMLYSLDGQHKICARIATDANATFLIDLQTASTQLHSNWDSFKTWANVSIPQGALFGVRADATWARLLANGSLEPCPSWPIPAANIQGLAIDARCHALLYEYQNTSWLAIQTHDIPHTL